MHQNKRTLKKRVRKVVFFCILITIILFSTIILSLSIEFSKEEASILSAYTSYSIAQEMNSMYFLKSMEIKGLEEFDPTTPKAIEWLHNLERRQIDEKMLQSDQGETGLGKPPEPPEKTTSSGNGPFPMPPRKGGLPFLSKPVVGVHIQLQNKTIFKTNRFDEYSEPASVTRNLGEGTPREIEKLVGHLVEYYSNAKAEYPILDSGGKEIGTVTAVVDINFLILIILAIFAGIVIAGLLSMFGANFISKLLVLPILAPLCGLNDKIRAVAEEDYQGIEKHIEIKKPLKEIEDLVESTNLIFKQMKKYSNLLEAQKEELQSQNAELEAQNEELIASRKRIEEQSHILENQKLELEAQNEELVESKRQIEEAQALLVQTENKASIGQLTAAITHEINTPLGAINSNVQICDMLLKTLSENSTITGDEELGGILEQLTEANGVNIMACNRVIEIIKSLKTFSRLDQAEFQEANIIEGMKSVLVLTSNLWKRRIVIHEEYEDIPRVRCFPGLLNQVFMNIIVNAIQAVENTGDIFIKTYSDEKDVCVSIRDNGSGIKKENLEKIFESGFSTKGNSLGMGLGLSICRNIIKKHNGEITVLSGEGKGTEFIIRIPVNAAVS